MAEYIDKEQLLSDLYSKQDDENLDVMLEIANFPAVDVAPVRHGRWILVGQVCIDGEYEDIFRCNRCGIKKDTKSPYCHRCGATMDGGDEDAAD